MRIAENYRRVRHEMATAAQRCGRNPSEIELVAVTKYVGWQEAAILYEEGQRDFGESRLPDALEKRAQAPSDCCWHFIGTLQSKKVRKVIENFTLIHSVDTPELAHKIALCSQELGVITPILLQANTSGELSKHGLSQEAWKSAFDGVLELDGVSVQGLMSMAPLVEDECCIRNCFAALYRLRGELAMMAGERACLRHLSMGMSHDFPLAIAEGATMVRIGSALFGD